MNLARLGLFLILCFPVKASLQISWDSPDFQRDSNGNPVTTTNLTSTGAPLDENFFFAIGGFEAGFDPETAPPATWSANFKVHGVARYSTAQFQGAPAGFTTNNFTGRRFLDDNNDLPLGSDLYIWGFNLDPETMETSEWILMRSASWTWPDSSGSVGGDVGIYSVTGNAADYPAGEPVAAVPGYGAVRTNGNGGEALLTTAAVSANAGIPRLNYSQWQDAYFGPAQPDQTRPLVGRDDDRDSDGVTNFDEYLAGFDPTKEQAVGAMVPSFQHRFVEVDGETFYEGSIGRSPFADVSMTIEQSTTLQDDSWSDLAEATPAPVVTSSPAEFRIRTGLSAEADSGSRFFRLRMEER